MKSTIFREEQPSELKAALRRMTDNMLISCVKRNGGKMEFSVAEIDKANDLLEFEVDQERKVFVVTTTSRQ